MLELRILSGLHRGAALPLDGDSIRLGSGSANDIVLTDPGMPEHGIELRRQADEGWTLRRLDESHESAAAIGAGMQIEVGPVLVGFADETDPWRSDAALSISIDRPAAPRRTAARLASLAALFAFAAAAALVTLLAGPAANGSVAPQPASRSGGRDAEAAASRAAVREVRAILHPAPANAASPPFGVLSVRGGAHGFIVTDDGHVLVPGNVLSQFTLDRIELHRIVFSGPHPAELSW
ncbi:hypothetical protein C9I57_29350 [Trinickia symbiotica]|uniref:YscD cytoplasmic domain-containing protein n=1 Tax=Trinickia symbiotica TaxID=863227 RepID=A0A2T3XKZ5_9BURK|nr:FHA domain-containing protein [Trinickia symbiotica]PTB17182.1 hypothetical protein C9I57_29350 [Trinickia symbiotica]